MKKTLTYLAFIPFLLSACTTQLEQPVEAEGTMRVTAAVGIGTKVNYAEGEEAVAVTWKSSGEKISMFQGQTGSLGVYNIDGSTLSSDGKNADFFGTAPNPSGTDQLYAIYPPVTSGNALNYPVTVMGQKGVLDEKYNYMFSAFAYNKADNTASFAFTHICTILKVTMTLPVSGTVSNITFSAPELRQASNFSAANKKIGSTGITRGDIKIDGTFTLDSENKATVYVYLLPNEMLSLTFSEGLTIKATVGGTVYHTKVNRRAALQNGVMYNVKATLSLDGNSGGEDSGDGDDDDEVDVNASKYAVKDGKLYVDGQEFFIKGVCYNGSNDKRDNNYDQLAADCGVNVIRTYSWVDLGKGEGQSAVIKSRINALKAKGLYVDFGFPIDVVTSTDFTNGTYYAEKLKWIKHYFDQMKQCDNIIMWNIGNEMENGATIGSARLDACWRLINEAAAYIRANDPYNRPITTTTAGYWDKMYNDIASKCPNLDFISINSYSPNVEKLHEELQANPVAKDKPYTITEYGPIGTWEQTCPKTSWGAVIEGSSAEKAADFKRIHEEHIEANKDKGCIGGFAFLWGWQSHGLVPTYYAMIDDFENYALEPVDAMAETFGKPVSKKAPTIATYKDLTVNGKTPDQSLVVKVGETLNAVVKATSNTGVALTYDWIIIKDENMTNGGTGLKGSGQWINSSKSTGTTASAALTAPSAGLYRLLVYARDDTNKKAALATFPFKVVY